MIKPNQTIPDDTSRFGPEDEPPDTVIVSDCCGADMDKAFQRLDICPECVEVCEPKEVPV